MPVLRISAWMLWAGYVAVISIAVTNPAAGAGLMSIVLNIVLVTAATLHGLSRYRPRDLLFYLMAVLVVANIMENLSIITGFPFGHYYYTAELGPKLFNVPVMIGVIYAAAGYFSWTVALTITRVWHRNLRGADVGIVPVVASICMVGWDVSMDPIKSTIQQEWIWEYGGPYFGVPLQNYFGWFLTVWIFYQAFSLWISRAGGAGLPGPDVRTHPLGKDYWFLGILFYAAMGLQAPLGALAGSNATVIDAAGQVWSVFVIKSALALITVFTMWSYAVFAAVTVLRSGPESTSPAAPAPEPG